MSLRTEASGSVPFGTDAVDSESAYVTNYPYCLNLFARRAMGRDLHHVRLVLSKPGIDAHGVCL